MKKSKNNKKCKFSTQELEDLIDILQKASETLSFMLHIRLSKEEKRKKTSKELELKTLSKEELKTELANIVENCFNYDPKEFKKVLKIYRKAIKFAKTVEEVQAGFVEN